MRAVHLVEEERTDPDLPVFSATPNAAIFGATVNRTLCAVYRNNSKHFSTMITDQGQAYWIKFCATLKYLLEVEGYGVKYVKTDINYFEDFFIELVKVLAINKVEGVQALVNKVVSIASSGQLFRAAGIYEDDGEACSNYLTSLFGTDYQSPHIKVWVTIPLYLRAVGGLLKIFEIWLSAEPTSKVKWEQPDNWELCDPGMPWKFELFLRNEWGKKLFKFFNCKTKYDLGWYADNCEYDEEDSYWIHNLNGSELSGGIVTTVMTVIERVHKYIVSGSGVKRNTPEKEKFHLHHMYLNFPGGFEALSCPEEHLPTFIGSCSRELFLFSSSEVFHPYSQFKIVFWNAAYNAKFWKIMENQLKGLSEPSKVLRKHREKHEKEKGIYMDHIMHAFLAINETRTAISLDSLFHDFASVDTTWESPDVIGRLLWNMPLCLNWLQILLLRIYEFESYFLPFVHFPVGRNVKQLAEDIYVKHCKLSRFLVKTAIVVAEYIYFNEDNDPGRCYNARASLKFAISLLVSKLKFFDAPAYQILELIVKESYNEKEIFNKESYSVGRNRVFVNLDAARTIPDFDLHFSLNYRSIYYYLRCVSTSKPNIEASDECYTKALELLQDYEKNVNKIQQKEVSDTVYMYDPILNYIVNMGMFKALCPEVMVHPVLFLDEMLHFISYDWLCGKGDLADKLLKKPATPNCDSSDSDNENDMTHVIFDLTRLAQVFLVCAAVLGVTTFKIVEKPDQILLSRLKHAECRSAMADTVSRFIKIVIQNTHPQHKPHPSFATLTAVEDTFKDRGLKKITIPEAVELLINAEQIYSVDKSSLPPLKVPCWSGCTDESSLTINVCKLNDELSNFRSRLLHEVSEKQFSNTKTVSEKSGVFENVTFKYLDILEYRFVEEMAALKTASKLKEIDIVIPSKLASLLKFRAEWLLKEFTYWCSSEIFVLPVKVIPHTSVYETAISLWMKTTPVLIQLQSIFQVYLAHDYTVHPVTESTIDILVQGQKKFLNILQSRELRKTLTEAMSSYYVAVEHLGIEYLANLLDHCILVWNIPEFCVDPMQQVAMFSLQHAEKIYTAMLHFFLFFSHTLLSKRRHFDAIKLVSSIAKKFVKAKVLLHFAVIDDTVDWDETCCVLQTIYLTIASFILLNVDHKDSHLACAPCWKGYVEEYMPLYQAFIGNAPQDALICLGLEDFLCKVFKEKSGCDEDANKKMNNVVCSNHDDDSQTICETEMMKLCDKFCKKRLHGNEISDPVKHVDGIENCDPATLSKADLKKLQKKAKKERYKLNKKNAKAQAQKNTGSSDNKRILAASAMNMKTEIPTNQPMEVKSLSEENLLTDESIVKKEVISINEDREKKINAPIENKTEIKVQDCNVKTEIKDTGNKQSSIGYCDFCGDVEQREQPLRKCAVCVIKQWKNGRMYCSSKCQIKDWRKRHLLDHSNNSDSCP